MAGRTVRCRCGQPLTVPGTPSQDPLVELLDAELARPFEPPPEREAPVHMMERRRRRRGPRQRPPRPVVTEPTPLQLQLWITGGLTGWLLSMVAIPTAAYLCLRDALAGSVVGAITAGVVLAAMLIFNRGCLALLLRAPRYLGWARLGGALGAGAFVAAGIAAQSLTSGSPANELHIANLFGNFAVAVMLALVPAFVAVAASVGPIVRPTQ